jgi:hypothetical protein
MIGDKLIIEQYHAEPRSYSCVAAPDTCILDPWCPRHQPQWQAGRPNLVSPSIRSAK